MDEKQVSGGVGHTPGPWRWEGGTLRAGDTEDMGIVLWFGNAMHSVDEPVTWAQRLGACGLKTEAAAESNARLIAAAPGLFAEIEREYSELADITHEWPGRNTRAGQEKLCRLRDLLALATGRAPQEVQNDYGSRAAIAKAVKS